MYSTTHPPAAEVGRRGGRRPRAHAALALSTATALLLGAGCGESPADVAARDSAALAEPERVIPDTIPRARDVVVVQLGAFADSTGALQLRDSLALAGWDAHVRRVSGDSLPPWRVRVSPSRELETAQLVAAGFARRGITVALVSDSAVLRRPAVFALRVNRGSAGARARVRWTMAPGRRALLVVEDAAAPGDGPLPDGFLYAAEGGVMVQRDSVWDVAPSPDWSRLAYGAAFVIRASGRDSVGVREWAGVAGRTNLGINAVRRGAFRVSVPDGLFGFAQPVVQPVAADSLDASRLLDQVRRPAPMAGGWRVRWSADGRTVAVGLAPERGARDDSPAVRWLSMDAEGYLLRGPLSPGRGLVTTNWTSGPVLEPSTRSGPSGPPGPSGARRIEVEGGWAESRDGWVSVKGAITGGEQLAVGPGTLLAASRTGELLAVLAPDPAAREGEQPARALVYRLAR